MIQQRIEKKTEMIYMKLKIEVTCCIVQNNYELQWYDLQTLCFSDWMSTLGFTKSIHLLRTRWVDVLDQTLIHIIFVSFP